MQTLILALARTGSSVLYNLIFNCLPDDKDGFFEPRDNEDWKRIIETFDSSKHVLVKAILRPYLKTKTNYIKYTRVTNFK